MQQLRFTEEKKSQFRLKNLFHILAYSYFVSESNLLTFAHKLVDMSSVGL